jgi:hypothetical protein
MKCNYGMVLALAALILTTGCKKSINSSVDLSGGVKAGFALNAFWQMPAVTGRLVRYDIGDGLNSDCILSYDLGNGVVTLTKFSGTTSTTLSAPSIGFNTDMYTGIGAVYVNNWNTDVTDNYNEIGGVHIIPFDYNGTGHEDHILLYVPGHGLAYIMHYIVNSNLWRIDWTNDLGNHETGSGIGGYDLMGPTDKIIAYDYGNHTKNYLICYRPGYGKVWVMHSNASSSNPNPPQSSVVWTAVIESSGGIGGFDMNGPDDQLVCIGGPSNGNMNVAAYRPGYGFIWFIQHAANSTSFGGTYSTRSGLNGYGLDRQDRIVTLSSGNLSPASIVPEDDFNILWYRPGPGISAYYQWLGNGQSVPGGPYFYSFNGSYSSQLLRTDPYPNPPYKGDHVLCFTGYGGQYNTSMLFYTPGANLQSQLYYQASDGSNTYNEVY